MFFDLGSVVPHWVYKKGGGGWVYVNDDNYYINDMCPGDKMVRIE